MPGLFDPCHRHTPGLQLQLRLRPGVVVEREAPGRLRLLHLWGSSRLAGLAPAVEGTLRELASGWVSQRRMQERVDASNTLIEHLWALDQAGCLVVMRLVERGRRIATVEPSSWSARLLVDFPDCDRARLSRFTFVRRDDRGLAIESAVSDHRVVLHDERATALLIELGSKAQADRPVVVDEIRSALIGLLGAAAMLEGAEQRAGTGGPLLEQAEWHDLLLHRRSRLGRHDGPFGAVFPFLDDIPAPDPLPRALADVAIPLPAPTRADVRARDLTVTEAIERRASVRAYGSSPLTMAQLGEFLFRCARVRGRFGPHPQAEMPYEATDRPYPSGGAVHDLELYLVVTKVEEIAPGGYHYAAHRHALEPLTAASAATARLLAAAAQASPGSEPPHVLITIASRFERMTWKYRSISYATTLKNVGVLYQTMYLVATAMGLGACALGSGDDIAAQDAFQLSGRSELAVGEFMLGTRSSDQVALPSVERQRADPTWRPGIAPAWATD